MAAAGSKRIYIVAGEASGDLLTAPLLTELRKLEPDLRLRGVGGDRMQSTGVTLFRHHRDLAVMGLVEVIRNWRRLTVALQEVQRDIENFRPDLLLLVDFPGFNLSLAARLRPSVPRLVYYISPKFWAWRYRRVHRLAALSDLVACIFPFEPELIQRAGGRALYEGHPLVDLVQTEQDRDTFFQQHRFETGQPLVTWFPGSRDQEVAQLLPPALMALTQVAQRFPDAQLAVHLASLELGHRYGDAVKAAGGTPLTGSSQDAMSHSDFAVVASGTANLETALLGTPQAMYYRFHPLTWQLARRLVKLDHASPVNIVLGRAAIPELLQTDLAERITREVTAFLENPAETAGRFQTDYAELKHRLGAPGVLARLAGALQPVLGGTGGDQV